MTEPGTSRRAAEQAAIALASEGLWPEAERRNRSLIELYGPDADTWNRLGRALSEQGRRREALDAYRAALSLDPANRIAQRNLGRLTRAGGVPVAAAAREPAPQGPLREDEEAEVPSTSIERGIAESDLEGYRAPYEEEEQQEARR